MIKFIFVLILFIVASIIFGADFLMLFKLISQGGIMIFKPIGMFIDVMNKSFMAIFKSYYLYLLLSMFLFIILFGFVIKFFVGETQDKISSVELNPLKIKKKRMLREEQHKDFMRKKDKSIIRHNNSLQNRVKKINTPNKINANNTTKMKQSKSKPSIKQRTYTKEYMDSLIQNVKDIEL